MYIETKDAQISGAVGRYSKKFAPGKVFTVYQVIRVFLVALFDADCPMRRCCVFSGLRLWCVLGRTRHSRRIRQQSIELSEAINAADIPPFPLCSPR